MAVKLVRIAVTELNRLVLDMLSKSYCEMPVSFIQFVSAVVEWTCWVL